MNSKFLISTKSSGLCFNIMRLIILNSIAKIHGRDLIFFTKPKHIPILQLFNSDCTFIPYVNNHTVLFNNYKRQRSFKRLYDLKYIKFIRDNYLNSMFDSISNADIRFICGCKYDIADSSHKFLLVDYNDGTHDTEILNSIKIPTLNDPSLHSMSTDYNNNIIAINIKVNDSNNTRIFEMWDKLIQKIKMDTNKPILLVSGNNEIKEILGKKYNCIYNNTVSETDYSFVRGNNIVRGSAYDIFSDVITCTTTDFLPFTEIRIKYADILRDYTDINFVVEKVEKFDILVEYMTGNIKVN